MERPENFGQSLSKISRRPGEEDGPPRAVPLGGVRFIFAGARCPKDMVAFALWPAEEGRNEREALSPYLLRFARFFRPEFFLKAACTAAMAEGALGGVGPLAAALRALCSEDPDYAERKLGAPDAAHTLDDDALCRACLWDFDEDLMPTFAVDVALRLFRQAGLLIPG